MRDQHHPQGERLPRPGLDWGGLLPLLVVYIVWGSTYLAIRVAVREGAGFPPFTLGLSRVLPAGLFLLLWARLSRHRVWPRRSEWLTLVGSGLLLWLGGNGLVMVAELRADSGYAALLITTTPFWVAALEAVLDRRGPSWLLAGSLLVGFSGVGVLSIPVLKEVGNADILASGALLLAALSWASGTVLQQRRPVSLSPQASSAYQQIIGGLGFLALVLLFQEPYPQPTKEAMLAWGYLLVFGSILAFTAYVVALRRLPARVVMTYAYVNPVIAVLLGWWLLDEPITGWTVAGAVLVLVGVAGIFRERQLRRNQGFNVPPHSRRE